MNARKQAKAQALVALVVLGLVDAVLPGVPVLALLLIYVVLTRPPWFRTLVRDVYGA